MKTILKFIFLLFILCNQNLQSQSPPASKPGDIIYHISAVGFLVPSNKIDSAVGYSFKMAYNPIRSVRKIWHINTDLLMAAYEAYDKELTNNSNSVHSVQEIKDGLYTEWNLDGSKKIDCTYKDNELNGTFMQYYPSGMLKRTEEWLDGEWKSGKCFDDFGNETDYCAYSEIADFNGGIPALINYLGKKIRYPEEAQKNGIEGAVFIRFVVEKDGTLSGIEVKKGVNKSLDDEAIRVVRRMPKWKPARLEGKLVRMEFTLPIRFRLE